MVVVARVIRQVQVQLVAAEAAVALELQQTQVVLETLLQLHHRKEIVVVMLNMALITRLAVVVALERQEEPQTQEVPREEMVGLVFLQQSQAPR